MRRGKGGCKWLVVLGGLLTATSLVLLALALFCPQRCRELGFPADEWWLRGALALGALIGVLIARAAEEASPPQREWVREAGPAVLASGPPAPDSAAPGLPLVMERLTSSKWGWRRVVTLVSAALLLALGISIKHWGFGLAGVLILWDGISGQSGWRLAPVGECDLGPEWGRFRGKAVLDEGEGAVTCVICLRGMRLAGRLWEYRGGHVLVKPPVRLEACLPYASLRDFALKRPRLWRGAINLEYLSEQGERVVTLLFDRRSGRVYETFARAVERDREEQPVPARNS